MHSKNNELQGLAAFRFCLHCAAKPGFENAYSILRQCPNNHWAVNSAQGWETKSEYRKRFHIKQ